MMLAAGNCTAQDETRTPSIALPDRIALTRLIDLTASELGFVVTYDQSQVQGEVTLRGFESIEADDLLPLLSSVLASKGWVLASIAEGQHAVVRAQDVGRTTLKLDRDNLGEQRPGLFNSVIVESRASSTLQHDPSPGTTTSFAPTAISSRPQTVCCGILTPSDASITRQYICTVLGAVPYGYYLVG